MIDKKMVFEANPKDLEYTDENIFNIDLSKVKIPSNFHYYIDNNGNGIVEYDNQPYSKLILTNVGKTPEAHAFMENVLKRYVIVTCLMKNGIY